MDPMSSTPLVTWLLPMVDKVPKDNAVTAGWTAFAVFIGLALAVAVLGWSLIRHLRTAEANKRAGAFGDEPETSPPAPE
jgi:hypothetical protein